MRAIKITTITGAIAGAAIFCSILMTDTKEVLDFATHPAMDTFAFIE